MYKLQKKGVRSHKNSFLIQIAHLNGIQSASEKSRVRINNINNVIIGTLNINSFVSKFDKLKVIWRGMFDILIINETKLDASFPVAQFYINGFSTPYRLDGNQNVNKTQVYWWYWSIIYWN